MSYRCFNWLHGIQKYDLKNTSNRMHAAFKLSSDMLEVNNIELKDITTLLFEMNCGLVYILLMRGDDLPYKQKIAALRVWCKHKDSYSLLKFCTDYNLNKHLTLDYKILADLATHKRIFVLEGLIKYAKFDITETELDQLLFPLIATNAEKLTKIKELFKIYVVQQHSVRDLKDKLVDHIMECALADHKYLSNIINNGTYGVKYLTDENLIRECKKVGLIR